MDRHRITLPRQQLTPTPRPPAAITHLRRQSRPNTAPNPGIQAVSCPNGKRVTFRDLSFKRVQVVISSSLVTLEYAHVMPGLRNPRLETSARLESMARLRTLNSHGSRNLIESARNRARRKAQDESQTTVSRKTRGAMSESGGVTPFTPSQTTRELVIGSPWAEGPGPCADLPRTGPCARTRCCYWQPLRMRSKWPGLCCVRKCDNRAVWTRPSQPTTHSKASRR